MSMQELKTQLFGRQRLSTVDISPQQKQEEQEES